ncbi:MAG: hypothetical protein PHY92_03985 [Alphaproteobacteria bacterium]|nr:hypothetical protein [Alphaproteobacteria bacterium]
MTIAYEPNYAVKKLIGEDVNIRDIITPEKIKECQKLVDDASASYFTNAHADMDKMGRAINGLVKAKKPNESYFHEVGQIGNNLKGQAELFGFTLVTKICVQIMECCKASHEPFNTRLSLIKELYAALNLCINRSIKDDGGEAGKSLLSDLDKYHAKKKSPKS